MLARVHAQSSSAAPRPCWGQSANSANTSRYSSVRFAPSQASPGTLAHRIEAKLSTVYAARQPSAIFTGVGISATRSPTKQSAIPSSASTISPPGAQCVSG